MSESKVKTYLIAGATRGVGFALVNDIASKDAIAIIYAGARDPFSAGASRLRVLVAKYPGRIEIVKYVAGDKEGNDALATQIGAKYGRIHTAIANAGISNYIGKIHDTPISAFEDYFAICQVNGIGLVVLFQSVRDLLKASPLPRFVRIGSVVSSLDLISAGTMGIAPYGSSKTALHWLIREIHFENEWLVDFPICPGPVDTDMTKAAVAPDKIGRLAEVTKGMWKDPSIAAAGLVDAIALSTREKDGGEFRNLEEANHPW